MANGNAEPTITGLLVAVVALALVAGSFALTFFLLGGANPPAAERPTGQQSTSPLNAPSCLELTEARVFESLGEMTATADLVAVGTVAETTVGKVIPDPAGSAGPSYPDPWNNTEGTAETIPPPPPEEPEDETVELYPTRFFDTSVKVEEVLKGEAAADTITVETLEDAYCPPTEWREPGTRALLLLSRSEEAPGAYVPMNISQSAYIVRGGDLVAARRDRFVPLVGRVAGLSLPELRREVEAAKEKIESGEVSALPEAR